MTSLPRGHFRPRARVQILKQQYAERSRRTPNLVWLLQLRAYTVCMCMSMCGCTIVLHSATTFPSPNSYRAFGERCIDGSIREMYIFHFFFFLSSHSPPRFSAELFRPCQKFEQARTRHWRVISMAICGVSGATDARMIFYRARIVVTLYFPRCDFYFHLFTGNASWLERVFHVFAAVRPRPVRLSDGKPRVCERLSSSETPVRRRTGKF